MDGNLKATFLGTDYNYAYSEGMREIFMQHATDVALCEIRTVDPLAEPGRVNVAGNVDNALTIALSRWAPQVSHTGAVLDGSSACLR